MNERFYVIKYYRGAKTFSFGIEKFFHLWKMFSQQKFIIRLTLLYPKHNSQPKTLNQNQSSVLDDDTS